jgi:hypothetical protein
MGDTTSKLGLYLAGGGSSGQHGADEIADVDNAVNDNLAKLEAATGFQLVTSGSRPSNPYLGMVILESDTGKGYVWSGLIWMQIIDLNQIGGLGGTTAARDAYWGLPGTGTSVGEVTDRATLANKGPLWFNTDKGYEERYFAKTGDTGATSGNVAATPAWYPSGAGLKPYAGVNFKAGTTVNIGSGMTVITTNSTFFKEQSAPVGGVTYGKIDGTAPGLRLIPGIDGIWRLNANTTLNVANFNLLVKKNSVTADYVGLVGLDSAGSATGLTVAAANISKEIRLSATDFLIFAVHSSSAGAFSNGFEENTEFSLEWVRPRTT